MMPEQAEATLVAATSVLPLLVARAKETRPVDTPEWITVGDAAELSGMSRFFSMTTGKSSVSAGRLDVR